MDHCARSSGVHRCRLHPDGRHLLTSGYAESVTAWDLASGTVVFSSDECPEAGNPVAGALFSVDVSPDGTLIATASIETVRVVDARTGSEVFSVSDGVGARLAWSPDSALLALLGGDGRSTQIGDRAGEPVAGVDEGPDREPLGLAFSPDGSRLATASSPSGRIGPDGHRVTIWDWRRSVALTTVETLAEALAFDPTGRYLASGDPTGLATVWDVATGREVATLEGHTAGVNDVVFSPDGARLATGSRDGSVRLWDPMTGVSTLELDGRQEAVWAVRFSPDGTQLASSGFDGIVRVWALDLDDLMDLARRGLTRTLSDAECQQHLHVDRCPEAAA